MNKKLRKAAQGRECQVRLPGVCNFNSETVVLAHIGGAGMARKNHDIHGAHCCSACHDAVDGRTKVEDHFGTPYTREVLRAYLLDAMIRTQELLIDEGFIKV